MKTDETSSLFRTLEPPPGGVERFRTRLENADVARRMPARRMLAAGLAAALIAVVLLVLDQTPRGVELQHQADAELPTAGNPAPAENAALAESNLPEPADRGESAGVAVAAEFRASPAFARLLGQPLKTAETRISVDDKQVAVAEIPSTNSTVRIYQIRDN